MSADVREAGEAGEGVPQDSRRAPDRLCRCECGLWTFSRQTC